MKPKKIRRRKRIKRAKHSKFNRNWETKTGICKSGSGNYVRCTVCMSPENVGRTRRIQLNNR